MKRKPDDDGTSTKLKQRSISSFFALKNISSDKHGPVAPEATAADTPAVAEAVCTAPSLRAPAAALRSDTHSDYAGKNPDDVTDSPIKALLLRNPRTGADTAELRSAQAGSSLTKGEQTSDATPSISDKGNQRPGAPSSPSLAVPARSPWGQEAAGVNPTAAQQVQRMQQEQGVNSGMASPGEAGTSDAARIAPLDPARKAAAVPCDMSGSSCDAAENVQQGGYRPGGAVRGREVAGLDSPAGLSSTPAAAAAAGRDGGVAGEVIGGDCEESGAGGEEGEGLETDYERARAERIRRNLELMRSMGLGAPAVSPKRPAQQQKRRKPSAQRRAQVPRDLLVERKYPLRSRRGGGEASAPASGTEDHAAATNPPAEEDPLVFDDSSVLRYVCEEGKGDRSSCWEAAPECATVTGFAQLAGTLCDLGLTRAYSVDWRPGLVLAGGKDGQVSIFGSREVEQGSVLPRAADVPPLLSARLHRGWISDVQFVRGHGQASAAGTSPQAGRDEITAVTCHDAGVGGSLLLLTAGNDGTLCLWDAAKSAAGSGRDGAQQPQQLAKSVDLHSGGIFSMHEEDANVVTASKDSTVVVSSLGGGVDIRVVRRYEDLHDGVVKCARWRDATHFASCGNDRMIHVVDTRQWSGGASCSLSDTHSTAINCLRWHPTLDHCLLSSSHDPSILLHDLRQPVQPLFRLTGHSMQGRISAIYQPAFVGGGAGVATGGEKSRCLTLYCTSTGSMLSRGEVDFTVGATFCGRGRTDPLICTATKEVHLLAPTWRSL